MNKKQLAELVNIAMIHVRADGPVSFQGLRSWIAQQVPGATVHSSIELTRDFLQHAIKAGLVEFYDDGESYIEAAPAVTEAPKTLMEVLAPEVTEAPKTWALPVSDEELTAFACGLEEKLSEDRKENYPAITWRQTVIVQRGKKFGRIVVTDGPSVSAFGFIDLSNGDILKTAGWKGPAKHARGNIRNGGPANWWNGACGPYGVAYLR